MKVFLSVLHETFRQWNALRVPKMGAALSFYAVFSLSPLAILSLSLVSLVVERDAARAEIIGQFRSAFSHEGAAVVELILTKTAAESASFLGTLIGFGVLLIGASGVFGELQDSLNQIWGVTSNRHPVFIQIKERIFSFAMVFVVGFLIFVSFIFSAILAATGGWLHGQFPRLDSSWEWANSMISLLMIAVLFALIFRLIPDTLIAWKDVWLGALISAVLFVLGKFLLGFYIGRSALASSYGAAGSLIIILIWVYYSAQILFFGAAFTRVYAMHCGSRKQYNGSVATDGKSVF